MTDCAADLAFRGLVHQVTDQAILARLDDPTTPITVYAGFDPTAPSLHVGNLLQLCTLRRLQDAGHRPISLAGGVTGMIGDPGGKTAERSLLTPATLDANLAGIRPQLEKFLDFTAAAGPSTRALLRDNSEWLGDMSMVDFLRDVGKHFTVNQMVAKESVKARFERPDHGISYTEFSYMLLQAYDFLRLHLDEGCTLQIGGSDQWGNITMGAELIRKVARADAFGLTSPLVLKADGTKFGKSESGTVWLDASLTSPFRFFQFFLGTEDAVVGAYLRYFTFLERAEITELDAATAASPSRRLAQRALARSVTTLVHGAAECDRVERASEALFGEAVASLDEATLLDAFEDAPSGSTARATLLDGGVSLVDALVETGLCASRGEARRAISQGGAYVNNRREPDAERVLSSEDLLHDRYVVLRRGRRDLAMLRVG